MARRGITAAEIRIQTGVKVHDGCYRFRRRAWIVLAPSTLYDEQRLRFVFGHELAHLLRNDPLPFRVDAALYSGLFITALLSFDLTALAIAFISALAHRVITRWWAELTCDAAAAPWSGIDALHAWGIHHRGLRRSPPNHRIGRRLIRLIDLLTHPPIALRLALQPRPR